MKLLNLSHSNTIQIFFPIKIAKYIYNFVVKYLDLIDDSKKIKKLYDLLNLESWGCSSILEHFPKEYIVKYIKGKHKDSKEMITKTKKLTKQEKLELMADYI